MCVYFHIYIIIYVHTCYNCVCVCACMRVSACVCVFTYCIYMCGACISTYIHILCVYIHTYTQIQSPQFSLLRSLSRFLSLSPFFLPLLFPLFPFLSLSISPPPFPCLPPCPCLLPPLPHLSLSTPPTLRCCQRRPLNPCTRRFSKQVFLQSCFHFELSLSYSFI